MTMMTKSNNFFSGCFADYSVNRLAICSSHFHHDFAMSFFDSEIWKNFRKKFIKSITRQIGFINHSTIKVLSFFGNNFFPEMNTQEIVKPIHDFNINRSKLKDGSIIKRIRTSFCLDSVNVKTAITVYIAGKISEIKFIFHNVDSFSTLYMYKPFKTTLNDLARRIRKDMRKSEHWTKASEENPKRFSRLQYIVGHKSNRLPVLNSAAARLGQAGRETQDVLQRDNLESTASVVNCVNGQNGDLPTEMAFEDLSDFVTILQNNSGEYITNMIPGQLKIGTSPIGDSYGCLSPTQMIPVFNSMTGFIRKFSYPNVSETLSTEWGGCNNTRMFVSDQGSITPASSLNSADVANNFVTAKEAYKVVWQAGGKMKFIYLPPGYNNDPAMLRHTAACNFYQGQCITNDLWIMNARSTMTLG